MYLNEAFKALDSLNEDTFAVSDDGIRKLREFTENDDLIDDIEIIDPEAETEDDLQDSYVGKVILDCTVCHSKIYKDKEEITLNDDETLVNVGEECPYCFTPDGFKVIGEVTEFEAADDEGEASDSEDLDTTEVEELTEEVNNINLETSEDNISVNTDPSGRVVVTAEPKDAPESGDEVISPVSPETEDEIVYGEEDVSAEDEEVDADVEGMDEESFDNLGESYFKKIYENVNSYKTSNVKVRANKVFVEGVLTFNSGIKGKTHFVFEAKDCTRTGKYRLIGENLNLNRGKKSYTLSGRIENKKFITESLNYNYKDKNLGKVRGTVRK